MKILKQPTAAALLLAAGLSAFSAGALAKDMKCNCLNDAESQLDGKSFESGGTTYKLDCKDTFKSSSDSYSTQGWNDYVKLKIGTTSWSSNDVNIQMRPRKSSECMLVVTDQDKKTRWAGTYCDTGNYKKITDFDFDEKNGSYSLGGAVNTATKQNIFLVLATKSDGRFYSNALCVENK